MSPNIKRAAPYVLLIAALIAIVVWIAHSLNALTPPAPEGIHVVCAHPDCGRHFVIPRNESRTYPRGPNGEGFKCQICNQFSAQIAVQCEKCGNWYLPTATQGRTDPTCPHCSPRSQN